MSHGSRIRLLQALVKPSLLYGAETWKLTPALLAKIIGAERAFSRWCMRLTNRAGRTDDEEGDLAAWVQWQADMARQIAKITNKQNIERWHVTAIRLHWQWAGKAARNTGTLNHKAATVHIRPVGSGRPRAHWAQVLRQFSIKELRGNAESWEHLAQGKVEWTSFSDLFVEFIETQVLRADTRAALARDAVAIRQEHTEQ